MKYYSKLVFSLIVLCLLNVQPCDAVSDYLTFQSDENGIMVGKLQSGRHVLRSHFFLLDATAKEEEGQTFQNMFKVFNIDMNPSEREDGHCAQPQACYSLTELEGFEEIVMSLTDKWDARIGALKMMLGSSEIQQSPKYSLTQNVLLPSQQRRRLQTNTINATTALSTFYHATNGSLWKTNTNWMSGNDPCASGVEWYGLTCSSGSPVSVVMSSNNLVGSMPSQFGALTSLTAISLPYNSLTGEMPSQVGLLTAVKTFSFSFSSFTGNIPSQLGQLTALTNGFVLTANQFTGQFPSEMGLLSSLTSNLDLSYNSLTGPIPSQVGQLSLFISNLYLRYNSFTGLLPSEIGLMSTFSFTILAQNNKFSGSVPSEFGMLTNLVTSINLQSNRLNGSLPSELGQLTICNTLCWAVSANSLTGSIPSEFGLWTAMTGSFYLDKNLLSGSLPSELGQLTGMKSIFSVQSNKLSSSLPSELGRMSLLSRSFALDYNSLTGTLPSQFGQLTVFANYFYVNSNQLSGSLPSELGRYTAIDQNSITNYFYFNDNSFCGDVPSEVAAITALTQYLSNTAVGTPCCEAVPAVFTCSPTTSPTDSPSLPPTTAPFLSVSPSYTPTPMPTLYPTLNPTLSPTTAPTYVPTYVPTFVPTPLPTVTPSSIPTYVPTFVPTPAPTVTPSSIPTSLPTFKPSPAPTVTPTHVPTIQCVSGSYLDGATCVACPIGQYSQFEGAPFPTTCRLCQAGKYNTQTGLTQCATCSVGKLSSADRSFCKDCEAGEYNFNNTECVGCEYGKYAPQALTGSCLACGVGSHTNNATKATSCTPCDAGSFSNSSQGTDECPLCPKGKYSSSGARVCLLCDETSYSDEVGSASCTNCPLGYLASPGASSCDYADVGYYLAYPNGEEANCPSNARCTGYKNMPVPTSGYWVDRSKYKYAGDIFKCSRDTCEVQSTNSSCWDKSQFTNASSSSSPQCHSDALQCTRGSGGPLCGSCLTGYVYASVTNNCSKCNEARSQSYVVIGLLVLVVFMVVFYTQFGDTVGVRDNVILRYIAKLDSGSLKVLWVTYQIIVSSSFTLGIQFPPPFSGMLLLFSVFSLDFLALECVSKDSHNAYYITVFLWSSIPIVIGFIIVCVGLFRIISLKLSIDDDDAQSHALNSRVVNQHIWLLLFLSYVVLPTVSNKQLQYFDCIQLASNNYYLRSDTSILCSSEAYLNFKRVLVCFVCFYQLIPISWAVLLYLKRNALNPRTTSNHDETLALFIRDSNANLSPLRFLFYDYKCNKWWFEIADMYRRILFIGILPLVSPNASTRASFGCILAIFSVSYFREEQPYRESFTNLMAHIAQFCILVTFYAALTIETNAISFGLDGTSLGLILVVTNMSIAFLAGWFAWRRFNKERKSIAMKESKARDNEDARGFSKNKFNTTFDALWKYSVPSSNTLVFYYTTQELALKYRQSGLPALKSFNGLPLTLRPPHDVEQNDFKVFGREDLSAQSLLAASDSASSGGSLSSRGGGSAVLYPNEEVMVLSLPRHHLDRLPGYEADSGLCMISAELLKAMRPTSFTAVLDSGPLINGEIRLPPTKALLRSFLISDPLPTVVSPPISNDTASNNITRPFRSFRQQSTSTLQSSSASSRQNNITNTGERRMLSSTGLKSLSSWNLEGNQSHNTDAVMDMPPHRAAMQVIPLTSVGAFLESMQRIRQEAKEQRQVALYHYTSIGVAPMILNGGLRMSSQGQGDGGVYVSTLGPASYGLGTPDYETNIIKDCFGVERIDEYIGKGKLDVIIVYGCVAASLLQAPGGRENAKVVSKTAFEYFSLPHANNSFFLRPDRILGCFHVDPSVRLRMSPHSLRELINEKEREGKAISKLDAASTIHRSNTVRINDAVATFWSQLHVEGGGGGTINDNGEEDKDGGGEGDEDGEEDDNFNDQSLNRFSRARTYTNRFNTNASSMLSSLRSWGGVAGGGTNFSSSLLGRKSSNANSNETENRVSPHYAASADGSTNVGYDIEMSITSNLRDRQASISHHDNPLRASLTLNPGGGRGGETSASENPLRLSTSSSHVL